jgi:hypothetical protein
MKLPRYGWFWAEVVACVYFGTRVALTFGDDLSDRGTLLRLALHALLCAIFARSVVRRLRKHNAERDHAERSAPPT